MLPILYTQHFFIQLWNNEKQQTNSIEIKTSFRLQILSRNDLFLKVYRDRKQNKSNITDSITGKYGNINRQC